LYKKYEECLKEKNVTSYQVSRDTGINQACLSNWKNGKYTPKADKLVVLATYFGKPAGYFIKEVADVRS